MVSSGGDSGYFLKAGPRGAAAAQTCAVRQGSDGARMWAKELEQECHPQEGDNCKGRGRLRGKNMLTRSSLPRGLKSKAQIIWKCLGRNECGLLKHLNLKYNINSISREREGSLKEVKTRNDAGKKKTVNAPVPDSNEESFELFTL